MAESNKSGSDDAEVSARAAELWRIAGSPPGREAEYRAAAESELNQDQDLTTRTAREHSVPEDQTTHKRETRR